LVLDDGRMPSSVRTNAGLNPIHLGEAYETRGPHQTAFSWLV
jgi:hypothetical protein